MLIAQNLRRGAAAGGERLALSSGPVRRSWSELADRVPRLAGGLRALGMAEGDRVAILSNNTAAFFELYLAAPWAGLVMASLNSRWSPREMVEALDDCAASALVVDAEFADLAESLRIAAPSVRVVIRAGDWAAGAGPHWDDLAQAPALADSSRGGDDPAYLFYTGGTTGRAKGVALSAMNFHIAGLSSLHTAGIGAASVVSVSVPLFHMSGGGLVAGMMAAGARADLLPRFEPETSMAAVATARATHVVWVPTMLTMLLDSPSFGAHDLSSLQRILYGSAPMPPALIARAIQAMPGVNFTQYYGMTEVTGNATFLGPEIHAGDLSDPRLRSVGVAVPGVEVRVKTLAGQDAPVGEVGEICIRGPTVTSGYWGQADKTSEAIKDGWMHTGDLGRMDGDGYVFLADRLKDMIVSGGENVYSSEVENALYQHPAVRECAVIGLPDPKWGEIVCAVIHADPGQPVDAQSLIAHCRTLIAGYKLPKRIFLSPEPLPKSAAGKILKTDLRRRYDGDATLPVTRSLYYRPVGNYLNETPMTAAPPRAPRFTGKVVIVSGAGAPKGPGFGNGRTTALAFAAEGAKVVAVDLHLARAEETVAMIDEAGGQAIAVQADVTRKDQVADLVRRALETWGRIDVLHNNVGVAMAESGMIETAAEAAYDLEMAVSAKSVFLTMQAVLPTMVAQGGGVITNTSSTLAARFIEQPSFAYTAAKAAVEAMTRSVAVSHGAMGVRVNCLRIGFMDTPLNRSGWGHRIGDEALLERALTNSAAAVPLGRMGTGLDSASAALFLASDEASYLNGVILPVDGGVELAPVHIAGLMDR